MSKLYRKCFTMVMASMLTVGVLAGCGDNSAPAGGADNAAKQGIRTRRQQRSR